MTFLRTKSPACLVLVAALCVAPSGLTAPDEKAAPAKPEVERAAVPAELRLPERGRKGRDRYGDALPTRALSRLGSERFRVLDPGMNVQLRFFGDRLELVSRVRHRVTTRDVNRTGSIKTLPGSPTAESFALSRDGQQMVSGCGRGQRVGKHVLKVPDDAPRPQRGGLGGFGKGYMRTCAAFDGAAKTVVTVRDDSPRTHLWDAKTGALLRSFPDARCDQLHVAMTPDGGQFACTTLTGVEVWSTKGDRLALHEGKRPSAVGYAEDGRTLAIGFADSIDVHDSESQKRLGGFSLPRALDAVAVTKDRAWVAGVMGADVRVWQLSSGEPIPSPAGHSDWITGLAFAPDGERLYSTGPDGKVLEWDVASGERVRTLMTTEVRLASLSTSADGKVLAAVSDDRAEAYRLFVLDVGTGALAKELDGQSRLGGRRGYGVVLAEDGSAALVSTMSKLELRPLASGGKEREVGLSLNTRAERLAATPTLSHAAVAARMSTSHPVLIDLATSQSRLLRLPKSSERAAGTPSDGHASGVSGLAFSRDGARLATTARGGGVYLWSVEDGRFLGCFQGRASAVRFDPSGRRLVLGTEGGGVTVIDARPAKSSQRGKCAAAKKLRSYEGHFGPVEVVEVSRDGKRIASGSRDGMILVWPMPR